MISVLFVIMYNMIVAFLVIMSNMNVIQFVIMYKMIVTMIVKMFNLG